MVLVDKDGNFKDGDGNFYDYEFLRNTKTVSEQVQAFTGIIPPGSVNEIKNIIYKIIEKNPSIYARVLKDPLCVGIRDVIVKVYNANNIKDEEFSNIVSNITSGLMEKGYNLDFAENPNSDMETDTFSGQLLPVYTFRMSSIYYE
jgi:hypothetical protein